MKNLFCSEHIADPNHNVLILARNGVECENIQNKHCSINNLNI